MGTLLVNRIQRFCLHDGPGIRTTVFVQGCPLNCWWCQNPETRPSDDPDAMAYESRALAVLLERDARYWRRSGGGVTVSGGEPLSQPDGLEELAAGLRSRGHHVTVDTSGSAELEVVRRLAPLVDLWLWDVKAVDLKVYRTQTGRDVTQSLANLAWLLDGTASVIVRVPLIEQFNVNETELQRIAGWLLQQRRQVEVQPLPGHTIGMRRHRRIGGDRAAEPLSRDRYEWACGVLHETGLAMLNPVGIGVPWKS